METLKLGASITVREPQVLLDPTLGPGRYRVTLVLLTDRGESAPAELRIVVREGRTPGRPIITPVGRFEAVATLKPAPRKRSTKRKSPTRPKGK